MLTPRNAHGIAHENKGERFHLPWIIFVIALLAVVGAVIFILPLQSSEEGIVSTPSPSTGDLPTAAQQNPAQGPAVSEKTTIPLSEQEVLEQQTLLAIKNEIIGTRNLSMTKDPEFLGDLENFYENPTEEQKTFIKIVKERNYKVVSVRWFYKDEYGRDSQGVFGMRKKYTDSNWEFYPRQELWEIEKEIKVSP